MARNIREGSWPLNLSEEEIKAKQMRMSGRELLGWPKAPLHFFPHVMVLVVLSCL